MTDPIQRFIEPIDRTEVARDKQMDRYIKNWMVDKELLKAVRDELKSPSLFGEVAEIIEG